MIRLGYIFQMSISKKIAAQFHQFITVFIETNNIVWCLKNIHAFFLNNETACSS